MVLDGKETETSAQAEDRRREGADDEVDAGIAHVEKGSSSVLLEEESRRESGKNIDLAPEDNSTKKMSLKRNIHMLGDMNDPVGEGKSSGGEDLLGERSSVKRQFSELQRKRAEYQEHLEFIDSNPSKFSYLQLTFNEFLAQTEALESEFQEGENQETIFQEFLQSTVGTRRDRELLWLLCANWFELVQRSKRQWMESALNDEVKTEADEEHDHTPASNTRVLPGEPAENNH